MLHLLHVCVSEAMEGMLRQYLYFCTSKASKLSTSSDASSIVLVMAFSQPRVPAAVKTLSSHNYSPRGLSVSLSLGVSCNAAASNWKREDFCNNDDCKLFCDQLYAELLIHLARAYFRESY